MVFEVWVFVSAMTTLIVLSHQRMQSFYVAYMLVWRSRIVCEKLGERSMTCIQACWHNYKENVSSQPKKKKDLVS